MTYKELQAALKTFKAAGKTDIKLNATKVELQAEYDRLTASTIEPQEQPKKIYTFADMLTSRVTLKPSKGFTINKFSPVIDSEIKALQEEWFAWKNIELMDELIRDLEECLTVAIAA